MIYVYINHKYVIVITQIGVNYGLKDVSMVTEAWLHIIHERIECII